MSKFFNKLGSERIGTNSKVRECGGQRFYIARGFIVGKNVFAGVEAASWRGPWSDYISYARYISTVPAGKQAGQEGGSDQARTFHVRIHCTYNNDDDAFLKRDFAATRFLLSREEIFVLFRGIPSTIGTWYHVLRLSTPSCASSFLKTVHSLKITISEVTL